MPSSLGSSPDKRSDEPKLWPYLVKIQLQARAFEPEPRLVPPLASSWSLGLPLDICAAPSLSVVSGALFLFCAGHSLGSRLSLGSSRPYSGLSFRAAFRFSQNAETGQETFQEGLDQRFRFGPGWSKPGQEVQVHWWSFRIRKRVARRWTVLASIRDEVCQGGQFFSSLFLSVLFSDQHLTSTFHRWRVPVSFNLSWKCLWLGLTLSPC